MINKNETKHVARQVQNALEEDITIEREHIECSTTSAIEKVCQLQEVGLQQLESSEWKVWSDSRPVCVARLNLVYCSDFVYIKWTRVTVENEGVATALWRGIVKCVSCPVFAKPVSDAMKHIAKKIGFKVLNENNEIYVRD